MNSRMIRIIAALIFAVAAGVSYANGNMFTAAIFGIATVIFVVATAMGKKETHNSHPQGE